jgi:hypothetical protein
MVFPYCGAAQGIVTEKDFLKAHIGILASPAMHGRGYVLGGREIASAFLQRKFSEFKLQPVQKDSTYIQPYVFTVNTFPGKMMVKVNDKELVPGKDYIIDAASPSYSRRKMKVQRIDLATMDSATWQKAVSGIEDKYVYVLDHVDSFCKMAHVRKRNFTATLPAGCYIISEQAKLTWTVAREQIPATVFYVYDSVLPKRIKEITVDAQAKLEEKYRSDNVIGMVPGRIKDSFIAFTAHYDHLGMMGEETMFPGASDNASGTSMLLYLASYFAKHPQRYSILFIAFSGEEAGLLGSDFYVSHPAVPLGRIKFLTNVDIMGDATNGVTVVNATEYPKEFNLLNRINDSLHYLPVIKSRGKAANSDHYHFSEAGVPAFFIYSNGGKGYYHDVYDKAEVVTLNNIDGVVKLLINFAEAIK